MEAYLEKNNIKYTKNGHISNIYTIENFTCFKDQNINIFGKFNEILIGKDEKFNNLIEALNLNNYPYRVKLKFDEFNNITDIFCQFEIKNIVKQFTINCEYDFNFVKDCIDYIMYNLKHIVKIICGSWYFMVENFSLEVCDHYLRIFDYNNYYEHIIIISFDEFIKFAQKNLSDYFIDCDIKIALKD